MAAEGCLPSVKFKRLSAPSRPAGVRRDDIRWIAARNEATGFLEGRECIVTNLSGDTVVSRVSNISSDIQVYREIYVASEATVYLYASRRDAST